MIDLHLHTTASDGLCTPAGLVDRARDVGLTTISVTDHDTMEAVPAVAAAAARRGLMFVPGIEVTAVDGGHDVHVLGYWLDRDAPELMALLRQVREQRVERAIEIGERLTAAGAPIDVQALLSEGGARSTRAIARPMLARALIAAGHVATVAEAFDRFLSEGRPAYVPHRAPSPTRAISAILKAGGIASLAHPGTLDRDDLLPELCDAGLTAIEAYHSAHDPETQARYISLARNRSLELTGGSDFHGDGTRRADHFGRVGLPAPDFERLVDRAEQILGRRPSKPS